MAASIQMHAVYNRTSVRAYHSRVKQNTAVGCMSPTQADEMHQSQAAKGALCCADAPYPYMERLTTNSVSAARISRDGLAGSFSSRRRAR